MSDPKLTLKETMPLVKDLEQYSPSQLKDEIEFLEERLEALRKQIKRMW